MENIIKNITFFIYQGTYFYNFFYMKVKKNYICFFPRQRICLLLFLQKKYLSINLVYIFFMLLCFEYIFCWNYKKKKIFLIAKRKKKYKYKTVRCILENGEKQLVLQLNVEIFYITLILCKYFNIKEIYYF